MSKKSEVIAIIPARMNSTRLPQKMLSLIHGKPLLQWTYENALRCKKLDRVLVATDSHEIYEVMKKFGSEVVMTSEKCPSGTDRVAEAVKNDPKAAQADIIVNIQGDEPEIHPKTIEKTIEVLEKGGGYISTACVRIRDPLKAKDPSVVKCVFDNHGSALYFSRAMIPYGKTGEFNPEMIYYKHIGIYTFKKDFLFTYATLPVSPLQKAEDLEMLKILENGFHMNVVEVEEIENDSLGIDTPEDLHNFITKRSGK